MTTGPIKPSEVAARKKTLIPAEVFAVFNDLIATAWDGSQAIVVQVTAADRIANALGITRQQVFDRHLLDVEEVYRAEGWVVEHDKPAYNETYDASFRFTSKRGQP